MEDLIKAHGWEMSQQSILEIPKTNNLLSVIPEYSYYYRDEDGKIRRGHVPQSIVLNCAIMSPTLQPDGDTVYSPVMYLNINSEEEFYDFMIEASKNINLEQAI